MLGKEYGRLEVYPVEPGDRRADREVILLLHGLGGNKFDWIWPAWRKYNYDHRNHPESDVEEGKATAPWDHLPHFSLSERKPVGCWSRFLRSLGHTVITYSQDGPDKEIDSAESQLRNLIVPYIRSSVLVDNLEGKKVTVLAHSRGGVLIRLYLTREDPDIPAEWLKSIITLHSPHTGSQLGAIYNHEIFDLSWYMPPSVNLVKLWAKLWAYIVQQFASSEGARQLDPDDDLFDEIDAATNPCPGVTFHTYAGTSVTLTRAYSWHWSAGSYIPRATNDPPFYCFDWELVPYEVPLVSPLLDQLPDMFDEIAEGDGDILVAANRAELGFSSGHRKNAVNHAEALMDERLFRQVAELLGTPTEGGDVDPCDPPFLGNRRSKELHDLKNETLNCQIDEILDAEVFETAELAKDEGYDGCYYCMGADASQR